MGASVLSSILLAELAVGRIIRAKNDSSGARALTLLVRDFGLSCVALVGGASDAREGCLRTVLDGAILEGAMARSDRIEVGLRAGLFELMSLRLAGREDALAVFAADAAVGAVIELGRRTGRVGDFVRTL